MNYRKDIDGLRTLAVLPVIFFHAGLGIFSGGFVGVDIFFVISGYLITTIILEELKNDKFSIITFYDRRARRILPALFAVMLFCLICGYFTMMPDEYKNLGQSLVATSFFSNNVLLALTTGYWDLVSEFKPLLHTWSLGVEEQYYIIIPLLLLLAWKFFKNKILLMFSLIFISSFVFANWFVNVSPNVAFYILPTRAWEIALGGIVAVLLNRNLIKNEKFATNNILSLLGLILICISIFAFDSSVLSPSYYLLIPTIGTSLIIIFSTEKTIAYRILSIKPIVFIGLLSYSLYLWHQPIFAFLRIYSIEEPNTSTFLYSIILIFAISYLSLKYIEAPFRNKNIISRKFIFTFAFIGSLFFVSSGLYLNKNYGIPSRAFDSSLKIEDLDKRIYNEKVYSFKKPEFSDDSRQKLLIVGNSFGRDFTNITLETFDTKNVEIIYTPDLNECIYPYQNSENEKLYSKADIIVFAKNEEFSEECVKSNLKFTSDTSKKLYYIGIKDFGHNLNWLIRIPKNELANQYNPISDKFIQIDAKMSKMIPSENYISLLDSTVIDNKIPITDDQGRMLSTDRAHLTKYGAMYFGDKVIKNTSYAKIFE
ncbi:acyltransferase family protein [Acinetobacter baumannii]|uniref:acyltransferase family protein n=1 Tax=Acinetobacter baumannii TaxID=470 RepID=UPI003892705D